MAFFQTVALEFLRRAHSQERLAHAYLITGPAGSGKRALAIQLAALVAKADSRYKNAEDILRHPDVHVAEPESKSRRIVIEQVRALERELQMRSTLGGRKVGIIFDADRLQVQASNAFLKTLEEPPSNSLLILVTANPELLLDTIISRCIPVQLTPTERIPPTPLQTRLLEFLRTFFRTEKPGIPEVFGLIRQFTQLLQEAKQHIQDENEDEQKKEETLYKNTTDGGKWIEGREDYYKALTEARYVRERFALADTLLQWWADVALQQSGSSHLDYPDFADDTARIARQFSPSQVLQRLSHIEDLRENFNRNVQEILAIESAFLKAFCNCTLT